MANILDGRKLRDELTASLRKKVEALHIKPKLVIIQIGESEASTLYINEKIAYGKKVGAIVEHKEYAEDVEEDTVCADIDAFNSDPEISGIIVQLPIPKTLNKERVINKIAPKKDVDGLTSESINLLYGKNEGVLPATTRGIITLLENHNIPVKGQKVTVVGDSCLVGRPTALALLNRKATVTTCHFHTNNLEEETRKADILIIATGKSNLITVNHVSEGQVVIDVGINMDNEGKASGDVNFDEVKSIVSAITPVPGGVGPMTVYSLFANLVKIF
jgi:methylenetetrahydrofolate dehydrogenase (NADP+)/methenyltetrahydrofolate cyclohydrolase